MRLTNELKQLGFDVIDVRILNVLHTHGPLLALQLAKLLPDPRTTVDYRLKRLYKRKWIEDEEMGKRRVWKLSSSALKLFAQKDEGALKTELYADIDSFLSAAKSKIKSGRRDRIYFLEPTIAGS